MPSTKTWITIIAVFFALCLAAGALFGQRHHGPGNLPAYQIVEVKQLPPFRTAFRVMLEEPATLDQVRNLSRKIRRDRRNKYRGTAIVFYLPGMDTHSLAWANAQFDPDLSVEIVGR